VVDGKSGRTFISITPFIFLLPFQQVFLIEEHSFLLFSVLLLPRFLVFFTLVRKSHRRQSQRECQGEEGQHEVRFLGRHADKQSLQGESGVTSVSSVYVSFPPVGLFKGTGHININISVNVPRGYFSSVVPRGRCHKTNLKT